MARKSARMLRVGMLIIINSKQRTITSIETDSDTQRVMITCNDGKTYWRTFGAKVDVISHG